MRVYECEMGSNTRLEYSALLISIKHYERLPRRRYIYGGTLRPNCTQLTGTSRLAR